MLCLLARRSNNTIMYLSLQQQRMLLWPFPFLPKSHLGVVRSNYAHLVVILVFIIRSFSSLFLLLLVLFFIPVPCSLCYYFFFFFFSSCGMPGILGICTTNLSETVIQES
jgi:hypothetical protein